ncbi:hypothetical protein MKEN_00733300 [Mycena kentingensis (nom. inval.)]|nr:hypothetical protein MKEN_00733300 [Mycena kentingensis (nom. inval.)]
MDPERVPTLADLRVKKCFICLDEGDQGTWVHPCPQCALLAHESCIARWTATLPVAGINTRNLFNLQSLRCPQCKRPYELAEPLSPRLHNFVILANTTFRTVSQLADALCALGGVLLLEGIPLGLSLHWRIVVTSSLLSYEVMFLRAFLGRRLNRRVVPTQPKDILNALFITLPTIPFRLLIPGAVPQWIVPLYAALPPLLYAVSDTLEIPSATPTTPSPSNSVPTLPAPARLYPPTPLLLGLLIPTLIRPLYSRLRQRLATYVLGVGRPPPPLPRRYISRHIFTVFQWRPWARRRGQQGVALDLQLAPATNDALADLQDDDEDPLARATRIIAKDQTSLTHDILDALAGLAFPPVIAMQLVLLALSGDGSGWRGLLRKFLCVRGTAATGAPSVSRRRLVANLLLGGAGVWGEGEPVWWWTSVGWGVYVVAKDLFQLYRLQLQTEQVRSHTIRDRDFAGVDVGQLDLREPERFRAL